jgi:3-dehydroquinate synthase
LAADLSQRMGWLQSQEFAKMDAIFKVAKLPTKGPSLGVERYLDLMSMDKKVQDGKIRLVLQQGIGKSVITSDYDEEKLKATLNF